MLSATLEEVGRVSAAVDFQRSHSRVYQKAIEESSRQVVELVQQQGLQVYEKEIELPLPTDLSVHVDYSHLLSIASGSSVESEVLRFSRDSGSEEKKSEWFHGFQTYIFPAFLILTCVCVCAALLLLVRTSDLAAAVIQVICWLLKIDEVRELENRANQLANENAEIAQKIDYRNEELRFRFEQTKNLASEVIRTVRKTVLRIEQDIVVSKQNMEGLREENRSLREKLREVLVARVSESKFSSDAELTSTPLKHESFPTSAPISIEKILPRHFQPAGIRSSDEGVLESKSISTVSALVASEAVSGAPADLDSGRKAHDSECLSTTVSSGQAATDTVETILADVSEPHAVEHFTDNKPDEVKPRSTVAGSSCEIAGSVLDGVVSRVVDSRDAAEIKFVSPSCCVTPEQYLNDLVSIFNDLAKFFPAFPKELLECESLVLVLTKLKNKAGNAQSRYTKRQALEEANAIGLLNQSICLMLRQCKSVESIVSNSDWILKEWKHRVLKE